MQLRFGLWSNCSNDGGIWFQEYFHVLLTSLSWSNCVCFPLMRISNVYVLLIAFVHHEVRIAACVPGRLVKIIKDYWVTRYLVSCQTWILVLITLLTSLSCRMSDRVYLSNGLWLIRVIWVTLVGERNLHAPCGVPLASRAMAKCRMEKLLQMASRYWLVSHGKPMGIIST